MGRAPPEWTGWRDSNPRPSVPQHAHARIPVKSVIVLRRPDSQPCLLNVRQHHLGRVLGLRLVASGGPIGWKHPANNGEDRDTTSSHRRALRASPSELVEPP
jgi:hypothetical protein